MFEEGLNEAQRAAVDHDGGPLLIVAGAGSGKTRTLAARVARLLHDGSPPERILLLTFSRRAAAEMLSRAGRVAGAAEARRVWGGTFHAVSHRLLRRLGNAVGLREGFTVLDQGDATDLFGHVRAELGLAAGTGGRRRRFPRKDTLAAIYSRTANAQEPLRDVVVRQFPWCARDVDDIKELFVAYAARKRDHNLVDFDDLLLLWRALAMSEVAGPILREQFDHVLVDEYQDTNAVQGDILFALCGPGGNLCAVGDDAQAIYGFRAASPRNMLEFPERYPCATVMTLAQNYRSIQPILDTANAVMDAAPGYRKRLWSEREGATRPVLAACSDEAGEATFVCDAVLEHLEQGVPLRQQAVLFRAANHSAELELELGRRQVPFVKYGGLRFLEAAHVKDVVALLRVVENPDDDLAWRRVLGLLEGVGPATTQRLLDALEVGSGVALRRLLDDPPPVPAAATEDLARLRTALAHCAADDTAPPAQLDALRAFCAPVFERRYDPPGPRLADIDQLGALASQHATRAAFLADLTVDPPASTSDLAGKPHLDDDYLILGTIHWAKGGEWPVVYLIHASDGCIPSDMALSEPEGAEEERRLLYVALTRARDALYVSYPTRYHHRRFALDDAHSLSQASRFLTPVAACFDRVDAGPPAVDAPLLELAAVDGQWSITDDVSLTLSALWDG